MTLIVSSQRKEGYNGLSFMIKTSFLVSFFLAFVILHIVCKMPSSGKMYEISTSDLNKSFVRVIS